MMNVRKMAGPALLATTLLAGGLALAADLKKPSGRVTINETQFGLIIGGSTGGGTLKFKGKTYPFRIGGLSVGATIGIARVAAVGEVYDLKDVSKFPGTYTALNAAIALGGGVGGVQMQNEHGVIMRLESRTQGVRFNLSTGGVTVTMSK
ncbi:MAG: DUF1134 domain-containing protein [Candidatus Competibacter sp.]|nr:DUF1134 domain-containing protein [Candidatus Competibacter sp.]MDS4071164.1 DUF1134 domain-containing protein [Candidatus Competibacter sp.]